MHQMAYSFPKKILWMTPPKHLFCVTQQNKFNFPSKTPTKFIWPHIAIVLDDPDINNSTCGDETWYLKECRISNIILHHLSTSPSINLIDQSPTKDPTRVVRRWNSTTRMYCYCSISSLIYKIPARREARTNVRSTTPSDRYSTARNLTSATTSTERKCPLWCGRSVAPTDRQMAPPANSVYDIRLSPCYGLYRALRDTRS